MRTLRKVRTTDVERGDVFIYIDENDIATHDNVYSMWPYLCLGAKVPYDSVIKTMFVSDGEYEEIQRRIEVRKDSLKKVS